MPSYAIFALVIFLLSACSVQCLLLAVFYPKVTARSPFNRRLDLISAGAVRKGADKSPRKRSIEETLREAEAKLHAKPSKPSLMVRMRQGEITWSKTGYYLVCVAVGLTVFVLVLLSGLSRLPAIGFGISAGLLLPHWFVNFKRSRRFKRFLLQFANSIDVIIRGVKVGVPLGDCLKLVAAEGQSPVKEEFRTITEDQLLGLPLADAAERLPERIPLPEARFFSIVIAMQSRSGGNLSEVLGNLSRVLRDRQKMQQKIKALAAESKASAYIIGSLPVFVAGVLYVTSPKYISLLITHPTGNIVLAVCAVWMLMGCLVMRKLINFEI